MRLAAFCLALSLAFAAFAATKQATYRKHGNALLPDPSATPGAVRTTDTHEVCSTTTPQFRHTTAAMKKAVCAEYGVKECPKEGALEIDHLIPLTLGGQDSQSNLWVQPAPSFHWKDHLEVHLHSLVCSGKLDLKMAQKAISEDWVAAYEKYIGALPYR